MSRSRRFAFITVLLALAIAINIVENIFIPSLPFGVKFGLANIISLVCVKKFGVKDMLLLNVLRVTLANLITGTLFGLKFFIGFGGIILSSISLIIFDKLKSSILFSSMISAFFHTLGQVLVVCYYYGTPLMITSIPVYVITAIITGAITGIIASKALIIIDRSYK